jgi:hypothetical protein
MKSSLFEYYKSKYKIGGKTPVNPKGMWYQDGDVVVPSNQITMKGPNGEKDYFDSPIMGIGMQSGTQQVMQPGQEYSFPKDNAVLEKKMQLGAVNNQERLNKYMAQGNKKPAAMPKGLSVTTGLREIQDQYLNQNQPTGLVGDLSPQVLEAIRNSGLGYKSNMNLPGQLGNLGYSGSYNPFDPKSAENLLSNLTYSRSFPQGSIRASADQQELNLRGKGGNLRIARNTKDSKVLEELSFNTQILPEILSAYGGTQFKPEDVLNLQGFDPVNMQGKVDANLGIQGKLGPLSYNAQAKYNPKTGKSYEADASLNLLKDRLKLSGNIQGQEQGIEGYNVGANLELGKNLNLSGNYSKQANQPGSYNIGLNYNTMFQDGGEIEDIDTEEDERGDDREMVDGVASILRRVKDPKNRLQLANQLAKQFNREKVNYSLSSFLSKSKVKVKK